MGGEADHLATVPVDIVARVVVLVRHEVPVAILTSVHL